MMKSVLHLLISCLIALGGIEIALCVWAPT